jgi:hypothetical protein
MEMDLPFNSPNNHEKLADTYILYLTDLKSKCEKLGIEFNKSDRILYNADKRLNRSVKLNNYGTKK